MFLQRVWEYMLEFAWDTHEGIVIFTSGQALCSLPLCFYAHVFLWWPCKYKESRAEQEKPHLYANKEMCEDLLLLSFFFLS